MTSSTCITCSTQVDCWTTPSCTFTQNMLQYSFKYEQDGTKTDGTVRTRTYGELVSILWLSFYCPCYALQRTVFLGVLYPSNVHRKCPKGTAHRGKTTNGAQISDNLKNEDLNSSAYNWCYIIINSFHRVEFKWPDVSRKCQIFLFRRIKISRSNSSRVNQKCTSIFCDGYRIPWDTNYKYQGYGSV